MSPTSSRSKIPGSVVLLLLISVGWLLWNNHARMAHVRQITAMPEWSVDEPAVRADSPTGYAQGVRRLILPESDYAGGQQIIRAQRLLAGGPWVQRHLDYENAPHGRPSNETSLESWWLAGLARADAVLTGTPLGVAVERAALYADPLLHGLLLIGAWLVLRKIHGPMAAATIVLGLGAVFPLAGNFFAASLGRPTGLLAANCLGLCLLAAALRTPTSASGRDPLVSFALAGAAGGLGLWLNAPLQTVVLGGLLLGGGTLRWLGGQPAGSEKTWRIFGVSGALVSLLGYGIEYGSTDFSWRLENNHPLYALAWLGTGEILARLSAGKSETSRRASLIHWIWAGLALAALPVVYVWGESLPPWQLDPESERLSGLLSVSEANLWQWLRRDGLSLPLGATLWSGLIWLVAMVAAWRRDRRSPDGLGAGWILAGPALGLLALACGHLSWWSLWQVAALALLPVWWSANERPASRLAAWLGLAVVPGLVCLWQAPPPAGKPVLSEGELLSLIERDLAHWLVAHGLTDGPRVLAPPALTGALHYYGGITGLGTFAWENQDGLTAAARIASAGSPDEAQQLMEGRSVTHIVIPGWDDFLDQYAGLGRAGAAETGAGNNTFIAALHRWEQPAWLRPRSYPLPPMEGADDRTVTVFAVGDTQDAPTAMSRLAEYFIETGRLELAARARQALRQHPGHVGSLVAIAMVDAAHRDSAAFQETVARLLPLLAAGGDRTLPWDRRLSLAVVLATAKQGEAARTHLQRCLRETTEEKLRLLPAQSLRQLLTLQERLALAFPTPELAQQARRLLPPETRERLTRQ